MKTFLALLMLAALLAGCYAPGHRRSNPFMSAPRAHVARANP